MIALLGLAAWFLWRRRKRKETSVYEAPPPEIKELSGREVVEAPAAEQPVAALTRPVELE